MDSTAAEWIPDIVIRPRRRGVTADLRAVWNYRELVYYLVVREIQGRYRRTALGVSWLLLRPALYMLVFAFVFGTVLKVSSDGLPYPLFLLAGLTPWSFFNNGVARAAASLSDNVHVITKTYFPRLVLPLASVASGIVDFVASLLVLLALMLFYQTPLHVQLLWLPLFFLAGILPTLALSLWLSVLTVRFRDLTYALQFILQVLMYTTPVVYSLSLVPVRWRTLYELNPLAGVVQGIRWSLFGVGDPPGLAFLISLGGSLLILVGGVYFFQYRVRSIVDTV